MWHVHNDLFDNPCKHSNRLVNTRGPFANLGSSRTSPGRCDRVRSTAFAKSVRDGITGLLSRRGIDYGPGDGSTSWLWCLGGPDLYRRPLPGDGEEYFDANSCVDLTVSMCERHRLFSASLYPYDLGGEIVDTEPPYRYSSIPTPLANDQNEAAKMFLALSEDWLDQILLLPIPRKRYGP